MRGRMTAVLIVCASLVLCGCSVTHEVENQAYALEFGVDMNVSGGVALTVRVPKIGSAKVSDDGEGDDDPYLVFSAEGDGYAQALESLQLAVPRNLNLSHIKLLVVSEKMAADAGFPDLVNRLAETPHLYTNARFAVCEGRAQDFIASQKVIIGTRLSAEIDALFDHLAERGAIPDSSFADVYYAGNSIYSDPVAARAFIQAQPKSAQPAARLVERVGESFASSIAPTDEFYGGAAVFRDGRMALRLDASETALLNLILGARESLTAQSGGRACSLMPEGGTGKRVDIDGDRTVVHFGVNLTCLEDLDDAQARDIEAQLAASLRRLIQKCQQNGVEPFGFAECAAGHFLTVPEWLAYDWRKRFTEADVEVSVRIATA